MDSALQVRILDRLRTLYGSRGQSVLGDLRRLMDRRGNLSGPRRDALWDERTVILITYGDQIRGGQQSALEMQRQFLLDFELDRFIDTVHILPFFPYSSDDGFSVTDYRSVHPRVGDWHDVDRMGQSFRLMFDFVLNHCSRSHPWFENYLRGETPYTEFFIEADPSLDLTDVVRPRSTPLLTPVETNRGAKHVWTTFSADQVDLNFASPHVLLEMIDILLTYIERGATVIRLDAIGFLWKRIGTTCLHLPETHAVVKLMRDIVDAVAPGTILITETNVPHHENVTYFGDGDEAHAVYQFSLAPLLLDALVTGDARPLQDWLTDLTYPGPGMTFLNFTASHDGIGVRPLEGLVPQNRFDALVEHVRRCGGRISMRSMPDGSQTPYELNATYLSALDDPGGLPPELLSRKFLASQGLMLSLRGIPGIYFHSLVGTFNDEESVARTGHNRSINRRKFEDSALRRRLQDEQGLQRMVLDGYRRMLKIRTGQLAFHPDAEQHVIASGHDPVISFARTSRDGTQRIHVLANVGPKPVEIDLHAIDAHACRHNLLGDCPVSPSTYTLDAWEIAWLT